MSDDWVLIDEVIMTIIKKGIGKATTGIIIIGGSNFEFAVEKDQKNDSKSHQAEAVETNTGPITSTRAWLGGWNSARWGRCLSRSDFIFANPVGTIDPVMILNNTVFS